MDPRKKVIEDLVRAENLMRTVLPEDDARLARAPEGGGWSPAEHALHCALVNEMVAERFREMEAGDRPGPPPRDMKKSLIRRYLFTTWRIPEGRPAPEAVKPLVILPRAQLETRLRTARDAMVDLADLCERPRNELWTEHPVLGPLSYTEWVTFILIHAQHHRRLVAKRLREL